MKYIEIKAPAKINIGLDILSKREDGFHNLSTLFYPIQDLFDTLHVERTEKFSFSCAETTIPTDDTNIVVKAKNLLEKISGKKLTAKIELIKRIPSQAGLGGGSSDAAAVLISLNEMFQLGFNHNQMIDLSVELGADVPFFIKAKPAIGSSKGEVLELVELDIEQPILLINPKINIATKEAFSSIIPNGISFDYENVLKNGHLDFSMAKKFLKNDFENFIFYKYPEIGKIKEVCLNNGAIFSLMSGSGSTVYGIFNNENDALRVMKLLPQEYFMFLSNPR